MGGNPLITSSVSPSPSDQKRLGFGERRGPRSRPSHPAAGRELRHRLDRSQETASGRRLQDGHKRALLQVPQQVYLQCRSVRQVRVSPPDFVLKEADNVSRADAFLYANLVVVWLSDPPIFA